MESREENRGMNLVIVHKDTRWKKFKGRITSWLTIDKPVVETVVVPEIIVTSPEDTSGSELPFRNKTTKDVDQEAIETGDAAPVKFRRSQKEELAKAHQDVIAQMRKSMAEARGDPRSDPNPEGKEKVVLPEKPPIPPTKAVAVAKIREAIAQAKRESNQDLASAVRADKNVPDQETSLTQSSKAALTEEQIQSKEKEKAQKAGSAREQLCAALCPSSDSRPETKEVVCRHDDTEMPTESEAEKAERKAAVRAKIRAALLSAAAGQVDGGIQGPKLNIGKSDPRRLSTPGTMAGGGAKDVPKDLRRRSASGLQQEKPKETIWNFFEEGKKKGTCKTCGYVVGIKHNKGGLTRHLSLVHQREYKDYTARMDKNWTHGMMERNLSMKIPKNI